MTEIEFDPDTHTDWEDVYYDEDRESHIVVFEDPIVVEEDDFAYGVEIEMGDLVIHGEDE